MHDSFSSPADRIAQVRWMAVEQAIGTHSVGVLVDQQMVFARAVWDTAFEAGHANGMKAASMDSKTARQSVQIGFDQEQSS